MPLSHADFISLTEPRILVPSADWWAACNADAANPNSTRARPSNVSRAYRAFANYDLARQEDVDDYVRVAVNPDLARVLLAYDACDQGMEDVGIYARDWAHLGDLCRSGRGTEYIEWCWDVLPEEIALLVDPYEEYRYSEDSDNDW